MDTSQYIVIFRRRRQRRRFFITSVSRLSPCESPGQSPTSNPTDRSRPGSKHHILVDVIAPIRGVRGRPSLQKPNVIYADRGYDSEPHRRKVRERGIKPVIAKRRTGHGSGLGKFRWVVERTHAWLHSFRRLRIRFEPRADIDEAFIKPGCALACWNIFGRTEQSF
jgi:transposase